MRLLATWFLGIGALFADLSYTLRFQPSDFTVTPTDQGYLRVEFPEGAVATRPGEPALPSVGVHLLLPPGATVQNLEIQHLETIFLAKGIPEPTATETYTGGPATPTAAPRPDIYHGTQAFPSRVVDLVTTGNLGGYRIAVLRVNPVRFQPATGTLEVVTRVTFTVRTRPARSPGLQPHQAVAGVRRVLDDFVRRLVANPEMADQYRILEVPLDQVRLPSRQAPTRHLQGGPFAYLIVTDSVFAEALQPLADFHTAWGLPTAIFTTQWIYRQYTGRNRADRIRNFLREAYIQWGVQYLLLAGDADFVPYQTFYHPLPHGNYTDWTPPSDWFYANLDGNWNHDGDEVIGEMTDSVDMFPELLVGRVPLNTPEQAQRFVQKVLIHSTMPGGDSLLMNTEYLNRCLWSASYLDPSNGWGYDIAERVASVIPTWMERLQVYETPDHRATVDEFVDAMNRGVGLAFVEAHGNYPFFAVNKEPYIPFGIPEIDLLANRYQWPILQMATCHSGGWDKTSILEYLLVGTDNGIVGGFATVRLDYPQSDLFLNRLFFQAFVESPAPVLGLGLLYQTRHLWAVNANTTKRYVYLSKALLGDPAMPVWVGAPKPLAVTTNTPHLGLDTLVVEVRDAETQEPLPQTQVVLWQPGGTVYLRALTDASGTARIPLYLSVPDTLLMTVHANGYVPLRRTLSVEDQGAALQRVRTLYEDFFGDGDGIPEAAESIRVHLGFRNPGTEPLVNASVRLVPLHPYALMPTDSVALGTVLPQDTVVEAVFRLYLVPETPDARYLKFALVAYAEDRSGDTLVPSLGPADTLKMWVQAPRARILRIYRRIHGDTLFLWPEVANLGHDDARNLRLRIRSASTFTEVLDSVYTVGTLPAQALHFDTLFHAPVRVRALSTNLLWIRETWTLEEEKGRGDTTLLHANREVSPPNNLRADPHPEGIRLHWNAVYKAQGYLVFRRRGGRGDWERLTLNLWPYGEYVDSRVSYGQEIAYRVVVVDEYWNTSEPSYEVSGTTQPPLAPGWPVTYEGGGESHHPVVADFDPAYPGLEILFGTSTGKVYALHADGTPVNGWPVDLDEGAQVWNSPALGDLDQDGQLELVVAPRGIDRVYAFEVDGSPVAGWPVDFQGGGSPGQEMSRMGAYASPVIYDLDQDGQPEVLVHGMSGKVWCWHGDGTSYLPGNDGLFASLWGAYQWDAGGLAVGDIDEDGAPEVVVTSVSPSGYLWALKHDGTVMPGFPIPPTPGATEYSQSGVALGDFAQYRPGLEIAFVWSRNISSYSVDHHIAVVDASGQFLPNLYLRTIEVAGSIYTLPVFADINNDDQLELLLTTKDEILVYDTLGFTVGDMLFNFPMLQHFAQPVLADITGENINEVFGTHTDGYIYAWSQGQVVPGFPLFVHNEIKTTPVVADLDQDGAAELVVLGLERVYVFDLAGTLGPSDYAWPMIQHDIYHTGNAEENPWWRHTWTSTQEGSSPTLRWHLSTPRPNPSQEPVTLALTVPHRARVILAVYDATGRRIRQLVQNPLDPGTHLLTWDLRDRGGRRVAPGLYFLHLKTPETRQTRRVLVLP